MLGLGLKPVAPVSSLDVGDSVAELPLPVPGVRLRVSCPVTVPPLGDVGSVAEVLDIDVLRVMILLEVPGSSTLAASDPVVKVVPSMLVMPDSSEDERPPLIVVTVEIELVPLCTVVVTTAVTVLLDEVNIVPSDLVIVTKEAEVTVSLSLLVEVATPEMEVVVTSEMVLWVDVVTEPAVSVIVTREGEAAVPSSPPELEAEVIPLEAVIVVTSLTELSVELAEETTDFVMVTTGGSSSPTVGDTMLVPLVAVVVIAPETVNRTGVPELTDLTVGSALDAADSVSAAGVEVDVVEGMVWVTTIVAVVADSECVIEAALELLLGVTPVKVTTVPDGAEEIPDPIEARPVCVVEVPPDLSPSIVVKVEPIFE